MVSELQLLLIEDDDDHAELTTTCLIEAGARRSHVRRGRTLEEGLRELHGQRHDVALLDLGLPGMQGLDTLRAVLPSAGDTPIVVLTALADDRVGTEAIRAGAQDYCFKTDLSPELLARTIRHAVERKRIATALESANEQLLHKNEELSHFAHRVAHDLKAPLGAISHLCGFVREDNTELNAESLSHLERAEAACARLGGMVDELLRFAELGVDGVVVEDVDAHVVLASVLSDLAFETQSRGAEIVEEQRLPVIAGNATLLRLILQNLIGNALKYSEEPPRIRVGAREHATETEFWVRDEGVGVPARALDRIFEVFHRGHPALAEGTGMGLATCRRAVELLHGRIRVESEVGVGSSFYFTLPAGGSTR